jgi:hypothetical protein
MARRSTRKSAASTERSSSKRPQASGGGDEAPSNKRTKRASNAGKPNTLPTRSKYFEPNSDEDDKALSESEKVEKVNSSYEDDEASEPPSSPEEEESDASSADVQSKKKGRSAKAPPVNSKKSGRGKSLLKSGADTGLEPGTQVIIKKPKPRDDGGIPYVDGAIHPNTMIFLQELAANNNREWLKSKFCFRYFDGRPGKQELY